MDGVDIAERRGQMNSAEVEDPLERDGDGWMTKGDTNEQM